MANTITNLLPTIYQALDTVSRELVGFIPAVTRNSNAERAAKDETIRYPVVPVNTAADIAPAATGPNPDAQTIGSETLTISKSRSSTFFWEGEEQKGLENGGTMQTILRDQFAQAFRVLSNEVETDLGSLYVHASRAIGTAGTTPFASTLADAAGLIKVLSDNGAPKTDLHLVMDTAAGLNMRSLTQLTNANQAASDKTLRSGLLLDLFGLKIGESAQVPEHTIGTENAGYLLNDATSAIGDTTIALDTGSGTIVAGDVITNQETGRDANGYVVKTALAAGSLVINNPGLRIAWTDDDSVENTSANYRANLAFARSAIHLVTRAPAIPAGGDSADDRMVVQDPVSGLAFDIGLYRQYHRVAYEVGLAWGYKAAKPEHIAILMG